MIDRTPGRWLLIGAGVVVVATLAVAMSMLGSPAAQREQQLDQRRVHDLQRIVAAIRSHARTHKALPPTLDVVARQPGRSLPIADPVDHAPYHYQVTGDTTFRLCAVFATDTARTLEENGAWTDDAWVHGSGRQCFDRPADEDDD